MSKALVSSGGEKFKDLAALAPVIEEDLEEQQLELRAKGLKVVRELYKAVSQGDVEIVKALVAEDIEWWFHGPRAEQHLMRMLTGVDRLGSVAFRPTRLCCVHDKFLAEGFLSPSNTCWVHVFTIKAGRVVELREYFNTSVTVTCAGLCSSSTLWQSQVTEHGSSVTSMPGLIVAV